MYPSDTSWATAAEQLHPVRGVCLGEADMGALSINCAQ